MKHPLNHPVLAKIRTYIIAHKVISSVVALVVLFAGYKLVKHLRDTSGETRYILGTAQIGSISSTVSASGQVSASNEIELKAKTSGDIVSVRVKAGDTVGSGALIASVDATDAGIALQSAEISLEKLTKPSDTATLVSAQNALTDAKNAATNNYTALLADVATTFQDFPAIITGMNDLLYGTSGYLNDQTVSSAGTSGQSYKTTAGIEFDKARREETALASTYATTNTSSSSANVEALGAQTLVVVKDLLSSLKDAQATVNYIRTIQSSSPDQGTVKIANTLGTTAQSNLSGWMNQITAHASSLTNDIAAIDAAPANIAAKQSTLDTVTRGADPLDVESEKLALSQKQSAYNDAFITAPFSGVVAKVDVKRGDSVSNGTAVATLVTKDQVAEVSLNEVDVAKVKVGDKAMLSFDAVDGLEISGVLSEVDQVGTVSQGVVSYSAKVTFDTTDPRILAGMSVSASIITDSKSGVLVVPTSAVKSSNGSSYVLVFDPALDTTAATTTGVPTTATPIQVPVEVGSSDDTSTEITSGLVEGQQVVVRTILPSSTTATAAPSLLGGNRTGAARVGR